MSDDEIAKRPRHPMQPLIRDAHGTVRFKSNTIVRALIDHQPGHPPLDLNRISRLRQEGTFSKDDEEQLMQLIGYSVSGFCDLSCASERVKTIADERCRVLVGDGPVTAAEEAIAAARRCRWSMPVKDLHTIMAELRNVASIVLTNAESDDKSDGGTVVVACAMAKRLSALADAFFPDDNDEGEEP